ncbi:MAG TPA: TetR/AcrR family transcriptional regulator [Acidimicrobiia bacterium]|nr:TetR/AcrR family transcriptional regulator [Acidimicrobiia bacterium]
MAEPVKRDSPNRSGRGQARTRLARRAVVDAARTLFLERGYVATTIEAISERSDVPTATVYRLFSSKLGILKALLDTSIAGDDQPLEVQERPDVASLFAEPDPHKLLAGFAGVTTAINERTNEVYRVLVSAAGSDPAAAELLGEIRQQRDQGQGRIARSLSRAHALKPGLRERDAADLIHVLMSPELYGLLVGDRGWTPERYQQWLATTLTQQLT